MVFALSLIFYMNNIVVCYNESRSSASKLKYKKLLRFPCSSINISQSTTFHGHCSTKDKRLKVMALKTKLWQTQCHDLIIVEQRDVRKLLILREMWHRKLYQFLIHTLWCWRLCYYIIQACRVVEWTAWINISLYSFLQSKLGSHAQ